MLELCYLRDSHVKRVNVYNEVSTSHFLTGVSFAVTTRAHIAPCF